MTIYFSSKNIPELSRYSIKERQEILAKAMLKLTVPEKLTLNLLKLMMLIPPFLFLARQEWGNFVFTATLVLLMHFFIIKPIRYFICRKHLK